MTDLGRAPTALSIRAARRAPPWRRTCAAILAEVREGGDDAVLELTERFDGRELGPEQLRVDAARAGGVRRRARARRAGRPPHRDRERARGGARRSCASRSLVELPEGQRVEVAELPVRRAGVYVPGGRAPYPSTVVMCAVTARRGRGRGDRGLRAARPGGARTRSILAACVLCGVTEVYRMGGAQAIAALAYGTESVARGGRDRRARATATSRRPSARSPAWWGSTAWRGRASWWSWPADGRRSRADRARPARPGRARPGQPAVAPSRRTPALLDAVADAVERWRRAAQRQDAELQLVETDDAQAAVRSPTRSPPSTSSCGRGGRGAGRAGCGAPAACSWAADAGTAFGDYVAGSNHVLPTGGAARFQSAPSRPATFRRRMARVSLPAEAAARLAPAGAALARAEGFPVHAESMERRA